MNTKKRFFINALILSLTSLAMQTAGVSFNAYISNKIGASGTGLYSLIMSVYVFSVTVANSGISLAATRLISEELATKNTSLSVKASILAIFHGLFFGSLASFILFFGSNFIGNSLLGDERTILALKILSISLPFVGMSAAISGYFTAVRRVGKSAFCQVFEQFLRICAVILFLKYFSDGDIKKSCCVIVLGGSLAEISSFLMIFTLYHFDKIKYKLKSKKGDRPVLKRLLYISLPLAFSAYIRSALRCVEHILIPKGLKKCGASSEGSLALYGVVHGMVMPVLLFPSSFLSAFGSLLIPEITEYQKLGKNSQIKRIMKKVYSVTFIFSVGFCGVFWAFSKEIGMAIYKSPDAAIYIKLLAPLTIAMYIDSVTDSILKGIGEQVYSMRVNILDAALGVILTIVLIPKYGIGGYIAVIFITELINAFLSLFKLIYVTDFKINLTEWLIRPALSILSAVLPISFLAEFYSDTPLKPVIQIVLSLIIYLLVLKFTTPKDAYI